jgi:hypothetical protein
MISCVGCYNELQSTTFYEPPYGIRGCRIALYDSMSTLNLRPKRGLMSGSGEQIAGDIYEMSDLTKPYKELRDTLIRHRQGRSVAGGIRPVATATGS